MKQLLFGFCLFFINCKAQTNHDLRIPDQVSTVKTSAHHQFPGTRVFVDKPKDYQLIKQLIRLQKNDNSYFQVIESPVTNFDVQKSTVVKTFEDAISSGKLSKEYYKKEFKFGGYNAILYYGPDNKPNLEQIVLCFGDKDFAVMAVGEIPANDEETRDEILKAMLSLYVDKNIIADASALANYSLDVSNTEFLYTVNVSQMFFYTVGGKGDPVNNPYENQIMVSTLPSMKENDALKAYAIDLIKRYKLSGMEIPAYKGNDITLNGNYAYEITFNGSFKGKPNSVYQVVTGDSKATILYLGSAYDRQEELIKQIKQISQTLRIK